MDRRDPASSRFAPYRNALTAISVRTGTPLPSLVFSFAILHELTAIVPLVGVFYGARALGVGERLVSVMVKDDAGDRHGWASERFKIWVDEGEKWAGRVGRRYGVFGFEKGQQEDTTKPKEVSGKIAGDVANAVVAYAVGKALLPVRIGVSVYLSPMFSRRIIEPIRANIVRPFSRVTNRP